MKLSMKTEIGCIRESNQDAVDGGVWNSSAAWAIVCDGMGGANGGNVASRLSVEFLSEKIKQGYREHMTADSAKNLLISSVYNANQAVFSRAKGNPLLLGMGTTVVLALLIGGLVQIAHVGDSRAFLVRPNGIEQLTKDHTIVQTMVDTGRITEEEAREHPQKHIITRALGVNEAVDIDYYECEAAQEDILLLCSDGLTNHVRNEQIWDIVTGAPFDEAAQKLIDAAVADGGSDNITVALLANDTQEAKQNG